jgi:hypothetical protein
MIGPGFLAAQRPWSNEGAGNGPALFTQQPTKGRAVPQYINGRGLAPAFTHLAKER